MQNPKPKISFWQTNTVPRIVLPCYGALKIVIFREWQQRGLSEDEEEVYDGKRTLNANTL